MSHSVIVCVTDEMPNSTPQEGACGHLVYVSVAGMEAVAQGAKPVCMACALGDQGVRAALEEHGVSVTPAIRQEFNDLTGHDPQDFFSFPIHEREVPPCES